MLKFDGAFTPPSQQNNGVYKIRVFPPEKFVAAQLSAGIKTLYKNLGNKKKTHQGHGSQTDEGGKFQPRYPVPLLAGRYKFVQVIGRGQSAVIVAAEDTFHPDKKPVAVKVMNMDYSSLGAQEAEFLKQLNKADGLKASRTVQLFNTFNFDGHYCLVFELLRPRPLHQYFQRCQFESEETKVKVIRKIALQLLQVLGFLKRGNVIHADLKPENILIEEGEEIKIKVIDFGNAIRYVHREVSLYYDEFDLQTLIYRAPEVMFGVPFGQEIDMWSVGCILAELHIGKPLFLGRTKPEILQVATSILGPLPRSPFQSGKFFQDLSEFVAQTSEADQLHLVTNLMKSVLHSRNFAFASFLVGLLRYKPSERLSPCQAAMHPFLASDLPFCYLLPQHGDKLMDAACGYPSVLLAPDQYTFKPDIDEQIKRQQFSGTELLKRGTKVFSNDVSIGKQVSPLATEQKAEVDAVASSSKAALITESNRGIKTGKSSYATEGPFPACTNALTQLPKENTSSGAEKDRRRVHSSSKNSRFIKKVENEFSNATSISKKDNETTDFYSVLERSKLTVESSVTVSTIDGISSFEWHENRTGNQLSSDVSRGLLEQNNMDVTSIGEEKPEIGYEIGYEIRRNQAHTKLSFDTQKCSFVDTSSNAARTRVYHRKSELEVKEEDDMCSEIKRSKPVDTECREKSLLVKNRRIMKSNGNRKKKYQYPLEQDSETAGSSSKCQDDVVILL